jgi:hypothetical protein
MEDLLDKHNLFFINNKESFHKNEYQQQLIQQNALFNDWPCIYRI